MSFNPLLPFNDLPKLLPRHDLESKAVLKKCIEARAAVAGLKHATALLPNAGLLIATLPLLEAQASSEIENIVTTTDRLFESLGVGDDDADGATKEALRYNRALYDGYLSLASRPLCTGTAVEVARTIKRTELNVRTGPGTALQNKATGETVYTPPVGEQLLRDLLFNWEEFLHEDRLLDPLVRMAVAHYQFEAIHPFVDGNGRTGRILNLLYLIQQDLLTLPVLYISRYIIRNKAGYYALLLDVTKHGRWEEWILYMLDAVLVTSNWTVNKINALRAMLEETSVRVRDASSNVYSRELLELIFERPYCTISSVEERVSVTRQTAATYLRKLCDLGILNERKRGKSKVFVHPALLSLLAREEE